jgi:hypothetical protein
MPFYNTTNEKQPELKLLWERTENQKEIVKKIFDCNLQGLTAFEAHKIFLTYKPNGLITSVRRAISDLTEEGYLVMTEDKRIGGYGAKNFIYKKK